MDLDDLRRVPLLAALPADRLAAMAAGMPPRRLAPGEVVAAAGAPAVRLAVLERGTLTAVRHTAGGGTVRLATVVAPGVVDKVAALGGGVHTATWSAATPARVRVLPAAELRRLVDEVPAVREHVLGWLAAEADRQRRSRVRSAVGPVARVADRLIEAGAAAGAPVRLTGGQQGLGEELGLSRVTVNRALRALAAAGAVRVRPGLVDVLGVRLLAAVVDQGR